MMFRLGHSRLYRCLTVVSFISLSHLCIQSFTDHIQTYSHTKVIVGFRKEQVNANFLNGKGEIKDVALNCSLLNAELSKTSPYIQAESVHVSKLSLHVASWRTTVPHVHLRLEHVTAQVSEPLHYVASHPHPVDVLQLSPSQLAALVRQGLISSSAASSSSSADNNSTTSTSTTLLDRIVDQLTVDILRVRITLQPLGTFKTTVPGPWTPPALRLELWHVQWRNSTSTSTKQQQQHAARRRGDNTTTTVHKTLQTEYRLSLVVTTAAVAAEDAPPPPRVIPLVASSSSSPQQDPLQVDVSIGRGPRSSSSSSLLLRVVAVHVLWRQLEVELAAHDLPHVHAAAVALASCLAKDRAFVDPLTATAAAAVLVRGSGSAGGAPVVMASTTTTTSSPNSTPGGVPALADREDDDDDGDDEAAIVFDSTTATTDATKVNATAGSNSGGGGHPLLYFCQSGTMIHERLSLRCSIHAVSIKGVYAAAADDSTNDNDNSSAGRVQLVARGVVVEALWPKVTGEKGGHIQASIGYLSVHEQLQQSRIRPLVVGGATYDRSGAGAPLRELRRDDTFPLFEDIQPEEDCSMRPSSFPAQAVGFKMTVGVQEVDPEDYAKDEVLILHEIGIDHIEVTADAEPWGRVVQFLAHVEGGGYDPRWESGDWSDVLTVDMLVRPNEPLHLEDHLQPTGSSLLLDENDLLSSDLFNVTMKLTNTVVRIPAAIAHDVRSCDVCLAMDELVVVVSSGLPRCLHTIDKEDICFPHDPADMVHTAAFGGGFSDVSNQSTFRTQMTYNGLSVTLMPVIPIHCGIESRRLIAPSDMMLLVCLEGVVTADNVVHMSLIVSARTQEINCNIDVDLLVSAASTLAIHAETVAKVAQEVDAASSANDAAAPSASPPQAGDIEDTMEGRKVLVEKQIKRSMESGGVRIAVWSKLASAKVAFWRHNVPKNNPLQPSNGPPATEFLPLLRVFQVAANGIDFGIEWSKQEETSARLRLSVDKNRIDIVNFTELMKSANVWQRKFAETLSSAEMDERASFDMLSLLRCGQGTSSDAPGFILRLEQDASLSKVYSIACELHGGSASLALDDLGTTVFLVLESLLLPVWNTKTTNESQHTVGSFFLCSVLSTNGDSVAETSDHSASAFLQATKGFCDTVLFRFGIDNTTLLLPTDSSASNYQCQLDGTEVVLSANFSDCHTESPVLGAYASDTTTWKSTLSTKHIHFIAKLSSKLSVLRSNVRNANDTTLIGPLELNLLSIDSKMSSTVTNLGKSWDMTGIEQIATSLEECTKRLSSISSNLQLSFWRHLRTNPAGCNLPAAGERKSDKPVQLTLQSAYSSVEAAKVLFLPVNQSIATLDKMAKAKVEILESTVTELRTQLFKKEEERLSAISLCVSQQRGWLRHGSPRRSGQRGLISCSLWPFWAVLNGTLMFLYSSPNQVRAVEF